MGRKRKATQISIVNTNNARFDRLRREVEVLARQPVNGQGVLKNPEPLGMNESTATGPTGGADWCPMLSGSLNIPITLIQYKSICQMLMQQIEAMRGTMQDLTVENAQLRHVLGAPPAKFEPDLSTIAAALPPTGSIPPQEPRGLSPKEMGLHDIATRQRLVSPLAPRCDESQPSANSCSSPLPVEARPDFDASASVSARGALRPNASAESLHSLGENDVLNEDFITSLFDSPNNSFSKKSPGSSYTPSPKGSFTKMNTKPNFSRSSQPSLEFMSALAARGMS